MLLLLFLRTEIIKYFQLQELSPYLLLIPVTILFAGISEIYNQWLIREQKFNIAAKTNFEEKLIFKFRQTTIRYA